MGQIMPAVQIELKSRVSGEIVKTAEDFVPGGYFRAGEPILHIDPEDYALAVRKQEAILQQAEADFKLEMGRQTIAKNELEILAKSTGKRLDDPALALREPQLATAKAELEKARSDLDTAKLNLRRTTIAARFNALVTERHATVGDTVSTQDNLATLVNTDEYWVKISVPIHHLQWLEIPSKKGDVGSNAYILQDEGRGVREGYLLKMTGTLDAQSRLADMLVAVPDPLLLNRSADRQDSAPLIIGDYVKVILEGKTLKKAFRLPLAWLHDGNTVWVMQDGKMRFREITPVFEDRTHAYITSGLTRGEMVITSDIPVAIDGMKVRLADDQTADTPGAKQAESATQHEG